MKNTRHISKLPLALIVALLSVFATQLSAATIVETIASQDNYIQSSTKDTVMDHNIDMYLKNNSRHAYFRFDLDPNADGSQSATGKFTVGSTSLTLGDGGFYDVRIYALNADFTPGAGVLGTSWSEDALTWNNAPGFLTSGADMTVIDTIRVVGGDEGNDFTFTLPTLSSYLQSDDTVTFLAYISGQSLGNNLRIYNSATAASTDKTTLTYTVVPEPSSFALLAGICGLTFIMLRRR